MNSGTVRILVNISTRFLKMKFRWHMYRYQYALVAKNFDPFFAMAELPLLCRADFFGWECARERKIISALVDIPEFCPAQFDREYRVSLGSRVG